MASNAFERQPAHLHFLPLHSSFSPLWPGCRVKHNTQIALPESAVPPDSWTQRAHFCLYLLFLSVALKVINQLLKPSSWVLWGHFLLGLLWVWLFLSGWGCDLSLPAVPFMVFFSRLTPSIISGPCLPILWLPSQSLAYDLPRITSSQVWRPSLGPALSSSVLPGEVPGALGSVWPKQNSFSAPCWLRPFLALT